jgi:rhodanese-related sulfurtransferase
MKTLNLFAMMLVSLTWANLSAHASKNCSDDSLYPQISLEELKKATAEKTATIIDVNSEESFKEKHVTGAIHYGSVKSDFAKTLPAKKDQLIVAYCGGPKCTAWKKAAHEACKLGYTNIKHFKDGIKGWK